MTWSNWGCAFGFVSALAVLATSGPALSHDIDRFDGGPCGGGYSHGSHMGYQGHGHDYDHKGHHMRSPEPAYPGHRTMMRHDRGQTMGSDLPRQAGRQGAPMHRHGLMHRQPDRNQEFTVDDVRQILEGQLAWRGNRRLQVGDISADDEGNLIADIVTKEGSILVDRLSIDPKTGHMERVP